MTEHSTSVKWEDMVHSSVNISDPANISYISWLEATSMLLTKALQQNKITHEEVDGFVGYMALSVQNAAGAQRTITEFFQEKNLNS